MKMQWTYYWTCFKWWLFMNITIHELFMKKYIHEHSSTFFSWIKIHDFKMHSIFMNISRTFHECNSWIIQGKIMNDAWSSRRGDVNMQYNCVVMQHKLSTCKIIFYMLLHLDRNKPRVNITISPVNLDIYGNV